MSFLKNLFGRAKLDGEALARSQNIHEYAQIDLLAHFESPAPPAPSREQRDWERVLPRAYEETLQRFQKRGWLQPAGEDLQLTERAQPIVDLYRKRQAEEKAKAQTAVRQALQARETSEALSIRRRYEARQPLGTATWTGPEPQLSHSALTRRILFLEHWLLADLSPETETWLKLYAAEEQLWGTHWRVDAASIPAIVQQELAHPEMDIVDAVYWRAYQLVLYVENQETWQRCKGGDHVRRIELAVADDDYTCDHCLSFAGNVYLVDRVPELPHTACTASVGCRCRYVPVLEI